MRYIHFQKKRKRYQIHHKKRVEKFLWKNYRSLYGERMKYLGKDLLVKRKKGKNLIFCYFKLTELWKYCQLGFVHELRSAKIWFQAFTPQNFSGFPKANALLTSSVPKFLSRAFNKNQKYKKICSYLVFSLKLLKNSLISVKVSI